MRIGNLSIHRKYQYDLDLRPLLCVHRYSDGGNVSRRVFCIWLWGVST